MAVICYGGVVVSESIRIAGNELDEAIASYMRKRHRVLIGERTAEEVKIAIGSAFPFEEEEESVMEIRGRNQMDGLPKNITIKAAEVREALAESLDVVVDAVKTTLEITPPELSADIIDRGITLTGGGALLRGLDKLIQKETGIQVYIAETPLDCVAIGTGMVLDSPAVFEEVLSDDDRSY